ncbi:MAG TPA: PAS domain S-box protein, partial [Gammaproteobacteria bacterium]|nr:PAS domain S-box protein [Gammaproteobacteria bacterium]
MSLLQHLMFIEPDRPLQTALESHYVLPLVGLSVLVAIVAAYTGVLLSERIRASETRQAKLAWLIAGATALGAGIWAMHFIGMLAFILPVAVKYDVTITAFSLVPAFIAGLVVLTGGSTGKYCKLKQLGRGVVMGLAINGMHYTGMAAAHYFPAQVEMTKSADWEPHFLALVIGLVVSGILILLISAVFISRRLALMNQLKTSEARLKMVFDTVVDGLIISDEKGLIQSFNQAAEKIFGYRRDE